MNSKVCASLWLTVLLIVAGCTQRAAQTEAPHLNRSPDYSLIPSPHAGETKAPPKYYQGYCVDHGDVTNESTQRDKVLAAVDAHNSKYHSGQLPRAVLNDVGR